MYQELPMSGKRPRDPVTDPPKFCGTQEGLRETRGCRAGRWSGGEGAVGPGSAPSPAC